LVPSIALAQGDVFLRVFQDSRLLTIAAATVLLVSIAGCGGSQPVDDPTDSCAYDDDLGDAQWAEDCTERCDCTSGICHLFGDGIHACTAECERDEDCPEGSQGQKCNRQGICRV